MKWANIFIYIYNETVDIVHEVMFQDIKEKIEKVKCDEPVV